MKIKKEKITKTQNTAEFSCIAKGGFGDPLNEIAHSMAWFRDRLYVGLSRLRVSRRHVRPGVAVNEMPTLDERAEIWCYAPKTQKWGRAFRSPLLKPDGIPSPRDVGYRKMAVFSPNGGGESLYVSTISTYGGRILCSPDGKTFKTASQLGLKNLNAWSFRVLSPVNGTLFISPTGRIAEDLIERNLTETPAIFESANPAASSWKQISEAGFGEPSNCSIFALVPFGEYLYAGTTNPYMGFQIWKARINGKRYDWQKVMTAGAFRGNANQSAVSMCVFGNALYVGTGIQGPGRDRTYNAGPAAAELIRIFPDDSWDLIVGENRRTFDGRKISLSGFGPGFDNDSNSVIWQLTEHNGYLYAGTHDWRSFLSSIGSAGRMNRPRFLNRLMQDDRDTGGFELWSSQDGSNWEPVTQDGFGNPGNYGVRTLLSTPGGLFLGTVSIPALGVAWDDSREESKGGCEIWWKK